MKWNKRLFSFTIVTLIYVNVHFFWLSKYCEANVDAWYHENSLHCFRSGLNKPGIKSTVENKEIVINVNFDNKKLVRKKRNLKIFSTCFEKEKFPKYKNVVILIPDLEKLFLVAQIEPLWHGLKTKLLALQYTVIEIKWSDYNQTYIHASSNSRGIARHIISDIEEKFSRAPKSMIHIIGMGIGAHIAGYIGKHFNGTIGRITGLNPARKFFEYAGGSTELHLAATDAQYVDVYHSDYKGFYRTGTIFSIGTVDFYMLHRDNFGLLVNKLTDLSTVRSTYSITDDVITKVNTCAYRASLMIFFESFTTDIWAYRQINETCELGNCIPMGFYSDKFLKFIHDNRTYGNYVFTYNYEFIPQNISNELQDILEVIKQNLTQVFKH